MRSLGQRLGHRATSEVGLIFDQVNSCVNVMMVALVASLYAGLIRCVLQKYIKQSIADEQYAQDTSCFNFYKPVSFHPQFPGCRRSKTDRRDSSRTLLLFKLARLSAILLRNTSISVFIRACLFLKMSVN